ncbi:exopolysaccharide biosynthesis protein [Parvularcula lutaonensis]|uniref:Exopolysaccharide biosynthesis protein n=1 Tax=Parvularcula lutaonensis TaxID=491923 RepID=A0ABV7MBB6_9PROT|nr:exopolysaccharide biosynthesis protein [Parvularcula lutaonensis]GGY40183.1 ABC transporter permease [Parvularcula lutaonensis]
MLGLFTLDSYRESPDRMEQPMNASENAEARVTVMLANVLERFAAEDPRPDDEDKITLHRLIDALDERAFGLAILILALPCAIPFLYGIPQIVSLPMLALAAQLAAGREHPWLPKALGEREVSVAGLRRTVDRAHRTLGFLERLAKPRLTFLSEGTGARIVGALMLIPAASILVPLPMTNTTPGIGVGLAAVGLLERDGLLILLGLAIGLIWVFLLVFFGAEAISAMKAFVVGRISG